LPFFCQMSGGSGCGTDRGPRYVSPSTIALDGPQHLLVINLMRAVRRGGCDSTAALVTMVEAATADIPGVADVSLADNLSTQCVDQTCKTARHLAHRRHAQTSSQPPTGTICTSCRLQSAAKTAAIQRCNRRYM